MKNRSLSVIALVVVNLLPLFGAVYWGWDIKPLLLIYWVENVATGFWTVVKMIRAQSTNSFSSEISALLERTKEQSPTQAKVLNAVRSSKYLLIPFFIMHYGLFTFVHGIFVLLLVATNFQFANDSATMIDSGLFGQYLANATVMFGLFMISHGISYRRNFIGMREFEVISAEQVMALPYKRVVVIHLAILIGAFVSASCRIAAAPYILIALKTIMDVLFHGREHRAFLIRKQYAASTGY